MPYRNSVLTRLLKESLGGNSRTVRVQDVRLCVCPALGSVCLLTVDEGVTGGHAATDSNRQGLQSSSLFPLCKMWWLTPFLSTDA